MSELLEDLIRYGGKDRVVTWEEYLKDRENSKGKNISFQSGYSELDYFTQGFQTGELIVTSGYSGMGKTLFVKSLIRSFGIENVPVVCFSYEDEVGRYLEKLKQEGKAYPLYVPMQLETGNLQWLEERVLEAKLKYNSRIVTIDHLHYLMDSTFGKENMSLRIGSIMRFLKSQVAVKHNMVVFIVAHQEKARDGSEASMDTIRDSSLIGHESDMVIIIQRKSDDAPVKGQDASYEAGYAMVKIDKARRAGTFRKRITFQKKGDWLEPV